MSKHLQIINGVPELVDTDQVEQQTTQQISPDNIVEIQHQEWLKHPCTIQLLKNLQNRKQFLLESGAERSGNVQEPDYTFRMVCYSSKLISTIIEDIKETSRFLKGAVTL